MVMAANKNMEEIKKNRRIVGMDGGDLRRFATIAKALGSLIEVL
jgi:hypothetical protein